MVTAAARTDFAVPPRNTRPTNRRELIVLSAAEMFAQRGYHQVGMADIAAAVNVRPSALYRHFGGKQELLVATIEAAFQPFLEIVTTAVPGDLDDTIRRLVQRSLDDRSIGTLWPREMRNVEDEQRRRLGVELSRIAYSLADLLGSERPELPREVRRLLAWCVLGVLNSIAFHTAQPPARQFEDVLIDLVHRVLSTQIPASAETSPSVGSPLTPISRREVILSQANILFAERGYDAVTMDDIGAAAGIAGPSVYNHFESKADILGATLTRGIEWLRIDLARVLSATSVPALALEGLVAAYVAMASSHPEMVTMERTEAASPDVKQHREASRLAQREYVAEWTHLLGLVHPDLDVTAAQITVLAFFGMVNGVVRTPQRGRLKAFPDLLTAVGRRLVLGET